MPKETSAVILNILIFIIGITKNSTGRIKVEFMISDFFFNTELWRNSKNSIAFLIGISGKDIIDIFGNEIFNKLVSIKFFPLRSY